MFGWLVTKQVETIMVLILLVLWGKETVWSAKIGNVQLLDFETKYTGR